MKLTPFILTICLLLSGCQMGTYQTKAGSQPVKPNRGHSDAVKLSAADEAKKIGLCQRQLEALQKIDAEQYGIYQQHFDDLMHNAAEYSAVRTNVNVDSQDTLDSLYHYRVTLFCSEINQVLLSGLAERGTKQK